MGEFLESSEYIDWQAPAVLALGQSLGATERDTVEVARRCYEYVRDEIRHCHDSGDDVVPARASEVLQAGTGYCYAKSHLLAALLRSNGIPTAMCYQKLSSEGGHTIHGLNAIELPAYGWYRVDPRGNNKEVNAQFSPPVEQLAFPLQHGDENVPGYWSRPAPEVIEFLDAYRSVAKASGHLPGAVSQLPAPG